MRLTGNLKSWATMRLAMKRTLSPLIRQRATSTCPFPASAVAQHCMLPSIIRMEPDTLVMKAGGTQGTLIQVLIPENEGPARPGRARGDHHRAAGRQRYLRRVPAQIYSQ